MPRKGPAPRRELMPDPVHRSVLVTQIVNKVLLRGKRSIAEKIVYDALGVIEQRTGAEPIATLKRAIDNVKPPLEVKSRRVGGATYQVPVEVRPRRANTLAIRWIVGLRPPAAGEDDGAAPGGRAARRLQRRRAPPSSAATTCRRWPSRTRPSPTTAGNAPVPGTIFLLLTGPARPVICVPRPPVNEE